MVLIGQDPPGATPLEHEDLETLIPDHIATQAELDEWEQQNIIAAEQRLRSRRPAEVLDDSFLRRLHEMMFGDTWTWAGEYRQRVTNLGVEPWRIAEDVYNLCENTRYQRDEAVFEPDELAVRFHHSLVSIHPFLNGNGRHARLAADVLVTSLGKKRFTWGRRDLIADGQARRRYLEALREADQNHFDALIEFSRS